MAILFGHGEEILQYARRSLTQFRCQIGEDQVWVLLRHGTDVWHIMAHDHVAQRKRSGGSRKRTRSDSIDVSQAG
jgi:hypothetical protein